MARPKHYAEIEHLIEQALPTWQNRLGLDHWEIELRFQDRPFDLDGVDDKTTAICEARWNYHLATITFFVPSLAQRDDEWAIKTLVHELCHVMLAAEQSLVADIDNLGTVESHALSELACQKLEQSTENTCRALWRAWETAPKARADERWQAHLADMADQQKTAESK